MKDEPILSPARLPGHLGELARRGFGGAAIRLIMEWGGTKRKIPKRAESGKVWVALIGVEATKILSELAGGENYDIPSKAWLKGDSLKVQIQRSEEPTREVAERLGCTERHVRGVRSTDRPALDPRQSRLFD